MERPFLVYVGGDDQQPIKCLYLGTDGDKAQKTFDEAGSDGSNSIVRFVAYPEHSQIRTPARDGVPPKAKSGKKQPEKPTSTAAPAASQQEEAESDGDDTDEDENGGV